MDFQLKCIFVLAVCLSSFTFSEGKLETKLTSANERAFREHPFTITCELVSGEITGALGFNRPEGAVVAQCDDSFDIKKCLQLLSGYSVTAASSNSYTLSIDSFSRDNDEGTWKCGDSEPDSVLGTLKIESSDVFSVAFNGLPLLSNKPHIKHVSVIGRCTYKEAECFWTYEPKDKEDKPVPKQLIRFSTNTKPCPPGEVETTCSLYYTTQKFIGYTLRLKLKITHSSLAAPLFPEPSPYLYFKSMTSASESLSSFAVYIVITVINIFVITGWL